MKVLVEDWGGDKWSLQWPWRPGEDDPCSLSPSNPWRTKNRVKCDASGKEVVRLDLSRLQIPRMDLNQLFQVFRSLSEVDLSDNQGVCGGGTVLDASEDESGRGVSQLRRFSVSGMVCALSFPSGRFSSQLRGLTELDISAGRTLELPLHGWKEALAAGAAIHAAGSSLESELPRGFGGASPGVLDLNFCNVRFDLSSIDDRAARNLSSLNAALSRVYGSVTDALWRAPMLTQLDLSLTSLTSLGRPTGMGQSQAVSIFLFGVHLSDPTFPTALLFSPNTAAFATAGTPLIGHLTSPVPCQRLSSMDLSHSLITGDLDLSRCSSLAALRLSNTSFRSVTFPASTSSPLTLSLADADLDRISFAATKCPRLDIALLDLSRASVGAKADSWTRWLPVLGRALYAKVEGIQSSAPLVIDFLQMAAWNTSSPGRLRSLELASINVSSVSHAAEAPSLFPSLSSLALSALGMEGGEAKGLFELAFSLQSLQSAGTPLLMSSKLPSLTLTSLSLSNSSSTPIPLPAVASSLSLVSLDISSSAWSEFAGVSFSPASLLLFSEGLAELNASSTNLFGELLPAAVKARWRSRFPFLQQLDLTANPHAVLNASHLSPLPEASPFMGGECPLGDSPACHSPRCPIGFSLEGTRILADPMMSGLANCSCPAGAALLCTGVCVDCASVPGADCDTFLQPSEGWWWSEEFVHAHSHSHADNTLPTPETLFSSSSRPFLPCVHHEACEHGGECAEGFQGPLCASCDDGHARTREGECLRCDHWLTELQMALTIPVTAALFYLFVFAKKLPHLDAEKSSHSEHLLDSDDHGILLGDDREEGGGGGGDGGAHTHSSHSHDALDSDAHDIDSHSHSHHHSALEQAEHASHRFHQIVLFLQVVGGGVVVTSGAGDATAQLESVTEWSLTGFSALTQCIGGRDGLRFEMVLITLSPLFVCGAIFAAHWLHHRFRSPDPAWLRRAVSRCLLAATFAYSQIGVVALDFTRCTRGHAASPDAPSFLPGNTSLLLRDTAFSCQDIEPDIRWATAFSALWLGAFPLLFTLFLVRHGADPSSTVAFLTHDYKPQYYWWEAVELLKLVAFTVISAFPTSSIHTFAAFATLALLFLLAYAVLQPFSSFSSNAHILSLHLILFCLCFSALLHMSASSAFARQSVDAKDGQVDTLADATATAVLLLLALLLLLFLFDVAMVARSIAAERCTGRWRAMWRKS